MTSATTKPRAGEHEAEIAQNCAKTSTVSASRCSLCGQQMRGTDWADRILNESDTLRRKESQTQKLWEESPARNSKLEAERDLLRERERALVEALRYISAGMGNLSLDQMGDAGVHGINDGKQRAIYLEDYVRTARSALAKHGR